MYFSSCLNCAFDISAVLFNSEFIYFFVSQDPINVAMQRQSIFECRRNVRNIQPALADSRKR
jgi:hypothetical protein